MTVISDDPARAVSGRSSTAGRPCSHRIRLLGWALLFALSGLLAAAQATAPQSVTPTKLENLPPRVVQAQRFLARRGWTPGQKAQGQMERPARSRANLAPPRPQTSTATAAWQPLGPIGVLSPNFGLVTGRVSSLALDPADSTGNTLYVGTTGGGVWKSKNVATSDPANIVYTPLTDAVGAMSGAVDASISIGALSVQPGGTGVVLAGTGDPNDALDSYYGAGVLRSANGGNTWDLVQTTADQRSGFIGEGFAGFAWSTLNPQLVVAAVARAWEGVPVAANWSNLSYGGLYYSTDSGASWNLSIIRDQNDQDDQDVQGPSDGHAGYGNAATSVIWNPVRRTFIAAVRHHGYYQSTDGITWKRLASQPGSNLTTQLCPTNHNDTGSTDCPIFRGALAVNPLTGDTFAWTVDLNNQDQGIWQDVCAVSAGACTNQVIAFGRQWSTQLLESNTAQGAITIANGDYNLVLAAVPSNQDTILLAGGNDLWKCSLAMGCAWRNTTNTRTCMSAQVAAYQHALAWDLGNQQEFFVGNDSGLWRSSDAIGETGPECASTDASHFQNLNHGLGSLAEVESMSPVGASPYTMMVGLGVNGSAGVKSTTGPTMDWPQILGGEGGPVAVDPTNASKWYVNDGAGVSIRLCAQLGACTPAAFGSSPVVSNADVSGDGMTMTIPATFLVDPVDSTQLLIGTCRVWRGPANGTRWTLANAISPMLDGLRASTYCNGNALIRSMAAMALPGGGEVIYVGAYGTSNGGGSLPGHVFRATMNGSGVWSAWVDITLNPVTNDAHVMNSFNLDISSLFVDPHDTTGNTVFAAVAGFPQPTRDVRLLYSSKDGGLHWVFIRSNLPSSPVNSLLVDPLDANTAYVATDIGVYATRRVATCGEASSSCWFPFGAGLPLAPVVALSAAPANGSLNVLTAGTYGRGVWQIPLLTAGTLPTSATADPASLDFGIQPSGSAGAAQTVTLTNTGGVTLVPSAISVSADFSEADNCSGAANPGIQEGGTCAIEITFTPLQPGNRTGRLTIAGNISGGPLTVELSGIGATASAVTLNPVILDFDKALQASTPVGATSNPLSVTVDNTLDLEVPVTSITTAGPFVLAGNACGTTSLVRNHLCELQIAFQPTSAGTTWGTLTLVDGAGTQTVQLSGTGAALPTDALSPASVTFAATIMETPSAPQTVTLRNDGDLPLTSIAASVSGPFQLSTNCTTQLAGKASCPINLVFTPTTTGIQTGILTVKDSLKTQTVPLSGIGILPPSFTVNPTSLTFAGQQVGVAAAPLTLTVTNSGGAPMANVGFQITSQSGGSFATGATNCTTSLVNGASCTVQVIFTPATSGLAKAILTLSTSTLGVNAVAVPLSGTLQAQSGLSASPDQLTFAAQAVGQASAPQTITISNTGSISAAGLALKVSGQFSLTQNNCGTSLAAGASCSAGVAFTPASAGALTGAFTATSSTLTTPATVALSGTGGLTGAVQLQPALLTFPTTGVGATSSPVTVTVTNSGNAIALADLVLTASTGFKVASNTCGKSLAAGAGCTVGVVFAPSSSGAQTGTLSLTSSVLTAAATVPLSGIGFDFTASAAGSSSKTVASGQAASYSLTLAPSSGSVATFTFQCSSLPIYAGCVFDPASETIPADATGSEAVQVTTGQAKANLVLPVRPGGWPAFTLACGLLVLPLAGRKRRGALLMAVLLLTLVAGGASGCASSGGGGGTVPPPPSTSSSTPAGTYSIPVTITSNGVQHSVTLTLIVD